MKRKWTKRIVLLVLAGVLILMIPASATSIAPAYTYASDLVANLKISGGTASCNGTVTSSNSGYTCSITVTLRRLQGGAWTTVSSATWTGSGKGRATASGTKSVTSGYSYKVYVTATIKDASGKVLESVSKQSSAVTY